MTSNQKPFDSAQIEQLARVLAEAAVQEMLLQITTEEELPNLPGFARFQLGLRAHVEKYAAKAIHKCQSPTCGKVFLIVPRAGGKNWIYCSKKCGAVGTRLKNKSRMARFRARARG